MAIGNFLTSEEAGARLGVTAVRVLQFRREGRLPGFKAGASWLFDRRDVERFAKKPRQTGRPKKSA